VIEASVRAYVDAINAMVAETASVDDIPATDRSA